MSIEHPNYRKRWIGAYTLEQIQALPNKEHTPIVITTGAIEQHGPQLPVGVDAMMAQAWLETAMPHLPDEIPCLVGPSIIVGKSNEHTGFPGSLMIDKKVMYRQLLVIGRQLSDWGFRSLLVINTHGGNIQVVRSTLREIHATFGMFTGVLRMNCEMKLDPLEAAYGFHANQAETSWLLALTPDLVEMELAPNEYPDWVNDPGELEPEDAPAIFSWMCSDLSTTGVVGNATLGNAEDGEKWLQTGGKSLAIAIAEFYKQISK